MSPLVLFWPEMKINLCTETGTRTLACAAALTGHPEIWKFYSAIKQIQPLAHARPRTCCSANPCLQPVLLSWIYYPHTPTHLPVSFCQETLADRHEGWDLSPLFPVTWCRRIRIFQEILKQKFTCQQLFSKTYFQRRTYLTNKHRHLLTLLIAQTDLCATLSMLCVFFRNDV